MYKPVIIASLLFLSFFWSQNVIGQKSVQILSVPAKTEYTHIDTAGVSVLASGRYVTPAVKPYKFLMILLALRFHLMEVKLLRYTMVCFTIIDNNTSKAATIGWVGDAPASIRFSFYFG
jgi:hypothetical protein